MRNGIIGKSSCLPLVHMPVVSSLIMSASLAGGVPPILGASNGHFGRGCAGTHGTAPPCNHWLRIRTPFSSRGVWHCPHIATLSTRYLPRATSELDSPPGEGPRSCVYAAAADKITMTVSTATDPTPSHFRNVNLFLTSIPFLISITSRKQYLTAQGFQLQSRLMIVGLIESTATQSQIAGSQLGKASVEHETKLVLSSSSRRFPLRPSLRRRTW